MKTIFLAVVLFTSAAQAQILDSCWPQDACNAWEFADQNTPGCRPCFWHGDSNGDNSVDVSDAIATLDLLFSGIPACREPSDFNDDDVLDISDPIGLLSYLFQGAPPPYQPFPGLRRACWCHFQAPAFCCRPPAGGCP